MRHNQKYVWGWIGLMLGIVLGAGGLALSGRQRPAAIEIVPAAPTATAVPTSTPLPSATPGPIRVFVSGAVLFPAVYELPSDAIVEQAVMAAGGFAEEAESAAVNLAAPLQDGAQVFVPVIGEPTPASVPVIAAPAAGGGTSAGAGGGVVDLNRATAAELETLPGIGPSTAQKIVQHREENGRFQAVEEIMNVSGIGPAKYEQIKELITIK